MCLSHGVKVGYRYEYGALTVSLSNLAKNRSLTWLGRLLTLLWTIICQDFLRRAPRCVLFGVSFQLKDHPTIASATKLLAQSRRSTVLLSELRTYRVSNVLFAA